MTATTTNDGAPRANRWSIAIWGGAAALLMVPAVAMRFTSEVDWDAADFLVMGTLLAIACGSYEVATRLSSSGAYRAGAAAAIGGGFLLVWVNLAVGVIGSENNPANLMYLGVLAVGLVGAILARFRARGLATTALAMAATQMLVAAIAIVMGWSGDEPPRVAQTVGASAFLCLPWFVSAALFWNAARDEAAAAGTGR